MNATPFRRLLALLLVAASLSAASALECGSFQVLRATDYDAFGVLIDRTGATDNSFLYCGERWDANLGFYYLRARYMNPGTGRFWTMDEFEGMELDPQSLHKYTYACSNPANRTDPSGMFDGGILGTAVATTEAVGLRQHREAQVVSQSMTAMESLIVSVALTLQVIDIILPPWWPRRRFDPDDPDDRKKNPNAMRVQLQDSHGGTTLNTLGFPLVNTAAKGVTCLQVRMALWTLYLTARAGGTQWFPFRALEVWMQTEIRLMSAGLDQYIPAGVGPGLMRSIPPRCDQVERAGVVYRIDIDNLTGMNLRNRE